MWARTRFDIGWADLLAGVLACLRGGDPRVLQRRLEARWSPDGDALACTSVRSGFDLLLRELELPPESEVLFSAINIKGMIKVVRRQGHRPVPADLDLEHAAPRLDALERAVGERTRVLVVAHLFGSRIGLDPIVAFASRHGLFLVEDCAQAFEGPDDTGHPGADASLFSFGPLKTATAIGGGLLRVGDPDLLARMRARQARYPVQKRGAYLVRVLKFAGLKALAYRPTYALLRGLAGLGRREVDRSLGDAVRGIARQKSAKSLEQRPCAAMLRLLERRLAHWDGRSLERRQRHARTLASAAAGLALSPGARNSRHAWWACSLLVKRPDEVARALAAGGFDAAPSESLRAIPAPGDRPELAPVRAQELLSQLVFLPCYPGMSEPAVARQAGLLREILSGDAGHPGEPDEEVA